jgi:hypothetical protein
MVTLVVAVLEQLLPSVTVTVYVPAEAETALNPVGSSNVAEKLAGPCHEKVKFPFPPCGADVSNTGVPIHTGLLEAATMVGFAFTCKMRVATEEQPFAEVTVKVYVPAAPTVAANGAGFCPPDVKLSGPVQE